MLKKISEYSSVVFLLATQDVVRHDYFKREDKQEMLKCIKGLRNPQAAIENVFHTMSYKAKENATFISKENPDTANELLVRELRGSRHLQNKGVPVLLPTE